MRIDAAQREVRTVFRGGFFGQLVSSALWLAAAALGTWSSPKSAIWTLCLGGFLIFPLTMLFLRATGSNAALARENPMGQLARQVAFTVPLNLPVVGAATLYRLEWFFPAFMIVLGCHYLPFAFLYGMWQFQVLGGFLCAAGLLLGLYGPGTFSPGGWITGGALLVFAFVGKAIAERK